MAGWLRFGAGEKMAFDYGSMVERGQVSRHFRVRRLQAGTVVWQRTDRIGRRAALGAAGVDVPWEIP